MKGVLDKSATLCIACYKSALCRHCLHLFETRYTDIWCPPCRRKVAVLGEKRCGEMFPEKESR